MARAAAADAGPADLLRRLDSVRVVYCQSWPYDDPVGRLTERIGADPKHRFYSGIGGTTPQVLVNDTAEAMLRGEIETALLVGAEALYTKRALRKAGERPAWSHRDPEKKPFPFEAMPHPAEVAHEVFQAYLTFALFDTARRAARGTPIDDDCAAIGELMAPMTKVAANNPHAWFPVERTADQLVTAKPENRFVGWPYTKYTVSVMDVDMAAALLLTTHEAADRFGIPAARRVYLRGWAYGNDPWTVAERADMSGSQAMRIVSAAALGGASVGIDDVAYLDLYSCFASSLRFACDALGIDTLDPRGLTVTGGLTFAGGPASNYVMHCIASMTERLRGDEDAYGLVSGVGMHMTKHCYAVYSPQPGAVAPPDHAQIKARCKAQPACPVVETYEGEATVAAYTVEHGRDGAPQRGFLVVDLPDGARTYARTDDGSLLADAESSELVGRRVALRTDDGVNIASW